MRIVLCVMLLSLTLSVFLADSSAQLELGCTPSTCSANVNRTIRVNDWGTTIVNDDIGVVTTTSVTFIDLGVPSSISGNLGFYSAEDSSGSRPVSKQPLNVTGGYLPLRVTLPGTTGTHNFTITLVFSGLLNFNASRYVFTYSPFPVVESTLTLTEATLTVETGDWASITASGIQGNISSSTFRTTAAPLEPYNTTLGELSFTSSTQNAFEVRATRLITITSSAGLHVADTYNITNHGRDVPNVALTLPKEAAAITVSDVIGPLEDTRVSVTRQTSNITVTVTPRFGSVKNGGGAYAKLDYDLSEEDYLTTASIGRYTLHFQMLDNVKFVQATLQTQINFPTGFRLDSISGQRSQTEENQVLLEASAVSPLSDLSFSMSFTLNPFWAGLGPMGLAALVGVALAAAVLIGGAGPGGAAVSGMAPTGLVGRLVELFDEKAALRSESEKLEEDMVRGAVGRHDFRRRRRTIDLRLSEIDRQLVPVKQEISGSQPRYADMVRRVDRAEAELQVVRSSLADLRNRYRSGGVARESYESLMSDLTKRKERAQQTIDNVVIGLREEAR